MDILKDILEGNETYRRQVHWDKVKEALKRYPDTTVVGAILDIHGHFSDKEGKIIITNINGVPQEHGN